MSAITDPKKCPISNKEAKNGETCAYDPTKMSFWTSKLPATSKPIEKKEIETKGSPVNVSTPSATTTVDTKCPVSGQAATNGETCAYDFTKMSYWTSKLPAKSIEKIEIDNKVCPVKVSPPTVDPKCPISGIAAKDGQTCAYDPTQASFWQRKVVTPVPIVPITTTNTTMESCPVRAQNKAKEADAESCPMREKSASGDSKPLNCFVNVASDKYKNPTQYNVYSQKIDPTNQMPSNANQQKAKDQKVRLNTERVVSTIPKAGSDDGSWVYPSPQMFWNALVRKNKTDGASEQDMDTVIAVHNNMNETTWKQVLSWEQLHPTVGGPDKAPKLLRFMGRPDELSPMARIKMLFSHPAPFDRHDWFVDRGGKEVRYVIDYYHDESAINKDQTPSGLNDTKSMQSIKVDVRPALDSFPSFVDRLLYMPLEVLKRSTTYSPLSFFPPKTMKISNIERVTKTEKNWEDIKIKCEKIRKEFSQSASQEAYSRNSIAYNRCVTSVVCPELASDFDKCLNDSSIDEEKINLSYNKMIECNEHFEMDMRQVQQQKQLAKTG